MRPLLETPIPTSLKSSPKLATASRVFSFWVAAAESASRADAWCVFEAAQAVDMLNTPQKATAIQDAGDDLDMMIHFAA
ncbi:hypothetical protein GCM10028792_40370 [Salinisphaera aquimarina]